MISLLTLTTVTTPQVMKIVNTGLLLVYYSTKASCYISGYLKVIY